MPTNPEVAAIFLRIAELMAYRDENMFKVRSYYRAALTLTALTTPLQEVADRDELKTLPGVGEAIAGKISEILKTGTCDLYERLKTEVPEPAQEMLRIPGLSPRLARLLELDFGVDTASGLLDLVERGDLADLEGTTLKVEDAAQILRTAEWLGQRMKDEG